MNENINLVEVLKDAPKGTKLYSPICGECEFWDILSSNEVYRIRTKYEDKDGNMPQFYTFTLQGKYCNCSKAECLLFPSKDNRDWSTFKAPWMHKHFEPGQKVLVPYYDGDKHRWKLDIYSHWEEGSKLHFLIDETHLEDKNILPFEGNENKLGKPVE